MNDLAGESGGGSPTPEPTVEFETVDMDTASIASFAEALIKDAENMREASQEIREQLKNPADSGDKLGHNTTFAVGADPRQETLHGIVVEHSQRMVDTQVLLESASISLRNTGKICKAIAEHMGDVDALNGASVDELKAIIGDVTKPKSEDV